MADIIQFPRSRHTDDLPLNSQEATETISTVRKEYSDEIAENCLEIIVDVCQSFGYFKTPLKIYPKDLILVEEAIKSALYRYGGVEHTLHQVVDQLIVEQGEEDQLEEELEPAE